MILYKSINGVKLSAKDYLENQAILNNANFYTINDGIEKATHTIINGNIAPLVIGSGYDKLETKWCYA